MGPGATEDKVPIPPPGPFPEKLQALRHLHFLEDNSVLRPALTATPTSANSHPLLDYHPTTHPGLDAYTPSCVKSMGHGLSSLSKGRGVCSCWDRGWDLWMGRYKVSSEAQSRPGRRKLPPNPPPPSWGPSVPAFKSLLGSWGAAAAGRQSRRMVGQGSGGSSMKCFDLCFDELIKQCLPCNLYHTPKAPGADNISSSPETITLMTQVSNTSAISFFRQLPVPYLLLGIPIGLALVSAILYGLLVCLLKRQLERTPADVEAGPSRELALGVDLPPHQEPKVLETQNSNLDEEHELHPLQECDGAPEPGSEPSHSFPVPATELGAMVLVTTKTTTTSEL
ncbi:tumor necrosis factor receptor superfamily member 13C [Dromiciops gliroides]|uniref:tumor necrosis factor receptor superfamily member 13C n=1 Tax=Dromiciops gliroides TaxID=33562 RepID=UPI001CC65757|nr:tumor necrosis factor receptor superfamily member 13C [Dromiciops gliroides]